MENTELLFYSFIVVFTLLQTMITTDLRYRLVIAIIVLMIIAFVYNRYKIVSSMEHSTHTFVGKLEDVAKKKERLIGDLDVSRNPVVAKLMASDAFLQDAMKRLQKYQDVISQVYQDIVSLLFKYYEIYADCLIGKKDPHVHIQIMLDYRRLLLNHASSMYVQLDHEKYSEDIHRIVLQLQACTYKCLNVLKNKYGTSDYVSPVPHNMVGDATQLFWR